MRKLFLFSILAIGCQTVVPAQPGNALPPSVLSALRKEFGSLGEVRYFDATYDLNSDGKPEIIVHVAGPMVCGSGGCNTLVFTPQGPDYRLLAEVSVNRPPIRVSPRSSHGWRDLIVSISGGGIPGGNAELPFDGKTYASNPTVPPARSVTDVSGSTVLIAKFDSFQSGKPLATPVSPGLPGTSWRLVQFQSMDDTVLTPDDRSKYTISFGMNNIASWRIDCNRGSGEYSTDGKAQMVFGPLKLTRAACAPASLHDRIVKQIPFIRSYVQKNGHLFLSLMADGGIFEFEPVPHQE